MNQYECSSLFGPDETRTAESPEGAAELYAEDHIDTDVDQLETDGWEVTVVDEEGETHEISVNVEVSYSFTATEN